MIEFLWYSLMLLSLTIPFEQWLHQKFLESVSPFLGFSSKGYYMAGLWQIKWKDHLALCWLQQWMHWKDSNWVKCSGDPPTTLSSLQYMCLSKPDVTSVHIWSSWGFFNLEQGSVYVKKNLMGFEQRQKYGILQPCKTGSPHRNLHFVLNWICHSKQTKLWYFKSSWKQ